MSEPAIYVEDLQRSFKATKALDGISLSAWKGTVLCVLGPNGAGKTTLIRILATLLPADGGRAVVGGHDVAREPHAVRSLIGLTGQYAALDEQLTGRENLRLVASTTLGSVEHAGGQTSSWSWSASPRPQAARCVRTRAACVGGWTSRPGWSQRRRFYSWTSQQLALTRAAAWTSGAWSRAWSARARPCS